MQQLGLLYIKSFHSVRCALLSTVHNKIIFSPSCVKKLKEIGEDRGLLRVIVDSGGCSGFQYKYEIDKNISSDDLIIENSGVKIVVDPQSMQFLEGSQLDYEIELIRSGFKVAKNPNSEKGCSCGSSFSLKLD